MGSWDILEKLASAGSEMTMRVNLYRELHSGFIASHMPDPALPKSEFLQYSIFVNTKLVISSDQMYEIRQ